LFGLNVGENGALEYELLAANGTRFGAIVIEPLQGFNLLRCVTDILPVIHSVFATILAGHYFHSSQFKSSLPLLVLLSTTIPN